MTGPCCSACGRPMVQATEWRRSRSSTRYGPGVPVVVDPTWRHEDGTVAVMPDGSPVCTLELVGPLAGAENIPTE